MNHSDIVQQLRTDMGNTNGEITRVSNSSAVPLPSLTIWQLPPLLVWDGMSPRPRLNPNQKMVSEKYLFTFIIDKNTAAHHLTTTTVQTFLGLCEMAWPPRLNSNQRKVCEKYVYSPQPQLFRIPPLTIWRLSPSSRLLDCRLPVPTLVESEIFAISNSQPESLTFSNWWTNSFFRVSCSAW